jgi:hypothetical protein
MLAAIRMETSKPNLASRRLVMFAKPNLCAAAVIAAGMAIATPPPMAQETSTMTKEASTTMAKHHTAAAEHHE